MATPYRERAMRGAALNPEDQPYFEGAATGKLLLKRCGACGEHHHYPRALCPFCLSERVEWTEARGVGEIYSYSVMRRGTAVPYAIAYVALAEGVTLMTNIVDCDLDTIRIGQKVKVAFRKTEDGLSVPVFAPV